MSNLWVILCDFCFAFVFHLFHLHSQKLYHYCLFGFPFNIFQCCNYINGSYRMPLGFIHPEVLCLGDVAEAWSLFLGASSSTVSVWWTLARSFGPHHTDGRQDGEGLNRMDALMEEIRLSLS